MVPTSLLLWALAVSESLGKDDDSETLFNIFGSRAGQCWGVSHARADLAGMTPELTGWLRLLLHLAPAPANGSHPTEALVSGDAPNGQWRGPEKEELPHKSHNQDVCIATPPLAKGLLPQG